MALPYEQAQSAVRYAQVPLELQAEQIAAQEALSWPGQSLKVPQYVMEGEPVPEIHHPLPLLRAWPNACHKTRFRPIREVEEYWRNL